MIRCAYCGKKLMDSSRFCPYCGKPRYEAGSEFAEKFDTDERGELLVPRSQEIFREDNGGRPQKGRRFPTGKVIAAVCTAAGCLAIAAAVRVIVPDIRYKNAETLYRNGDYSEAEKAFAELDGYKNSENYLQKCGYETALALMAEGRYPEAADAFTALNGYADSDSLAADCMVEIGNEYAESGNLAAAASVYAAAGKPDLIKPSARKKAASMAEEGDFYGAADISAKYGDPEEALEYRYQGALSSKADGDRKTAADNFYLLGAYKDSEEQAEKCAYGYYKALCENGVCEEAVRGLFFLGDYLDSRELFEQAAYDYGILCYDNGDYFTAAAMFRNCGNHSELYKARYVLGSSLLESDPASARSVFALMGTYSDSAKKKRAAEEALENDESWYADCYTETEGYCTSVFEKSDLLTVHCTAGTDTLSQPADLTVTLTDSAGTAVAADCENVRNSGSFSVSVSLSGFSAGTMEIIVTRSDSGSVLRRIEITII